MQIELVYAKKHDYVKEGTLVGISIEDTIFYLEGYDSGVSKSSETLEKMSKGVEHHLTHLLYLEELVLKNVFPQPPNKEVKEVKEVATPLIKDRKRLDP